jgi:hypothetical protein
MRWWWVGLLLGATPLRAQHFVIDHDACWRCLDSYQHVAIGAAADLMASGPWFAKGVRDRAWKRVALVTVAGILYETTQAFPSNKTPRPGFGFGPKDLACDVVGAVLMEGVRWVIKQW